MWLRFLFVAFHTHAKSETRRPGALGRQRPHPVWPTQLFTALTEPDVGAVVLARELLLHSRWAGPRVQHACASA